MALFTKSTPGEVFWLLCGLSIAPSVTLVILSTWNLFVSPPEFPLALATSLFSFTAVPLFIMSLKYFKHTFRRAYVLLCVGVTLYGIGQLQFPLFEIIDGTAWVDSGAVVLPYIVSIVCIFFGMRSFAKLAGIKSRWMAPWLAFPIAVIVAFLTGLVVTGDQAIVMQLELFLAALLLFSVMIALKIKMIAAKYYSQPLGLLVASFSMLIVAALHHIITASFLPGDNWYLNSGLALWPAFVAALLFAWAGLAFATIRSREAAVVDSVSPVDAVRYVADLASNQTAIEPQLKALRSISESMSVGDAPIVALTLQQEATLASIYEELETYLVEQEPLRHFTKVGLRDMVRARFQFSPTKTSIFYSLFD